MDEVAVTDEATLRALLGGEPTPAARGKDRDRLHVEQVVHHCSQAFPRTRLGDPQTFDPTATVPRRAVVAHELERPEASHEVLDAYGGPSYAEGLYRS